MTATERDKTTAVRDIWDYNCWGYRTTTVRERYETTTVRNVGLSCERLITTTVRVRITSVRLSELQLCGSHNYNWCA